MENEALVRIASTLADITSDAKTKGGVKKEEEIYFGARKGSYNIVRMSYRVTDGSDMLPEKYRLEAKKSFQEGYENLLNDFLMDVEELKLQEEDKNVVPVKNWRGVVTNQRKGRTIYGELSDYAGMVNKTVMIPDLLRDRITNKGDYEANKAAVKNIIDALTQCESEFESTNAVSDTSVKSLQSAVKSMESVNPLVTVQDDPNEYVGYMMVKAY
jgi:hypothetical protein